MQTHERAHMSILELLQRELEPSGYLDPLDDRKRIPEYWLVTINARYEENHENCREMLDIPVDSHCGIEIVHRIMAAVDFNLTMDSHSAISDGLIEAVMTHASIIYYG